MSLWTKIQSLGPEYQKQILGLYNEENDKYKFPIEVRNLFADVIESTVCGGNISGVDEGLDPNNSEHRHLIVNFFDLLIGELERRLANDQAGDQFFTRLKLSETLANLKENKFNDPLGMYEHIRKHIKQETKMIMKQEEADSANNMLQAQDIIMENIQGIKSNVAGGTSVLKEMRVNEENFALNLNKKQEIDSIFASAQQLQTFVERYPGYDVQLKGDLGTLENLIQQNITTFQLLMERFEYTVINNLHSVSILQGQIISEKLSVWKHEQQKMANGIPGRHDVAIDRLQLWCEELAELLWRIYEQLKEAEHIIEKGLVPSGNSAYLTFVQGRTDEVLKLVQELLNKSLIVEEQPPQIIKMKTKFPKVVVVSMLVGRRLNIHMNTLELSAYLISEEQARSLPVTDKIETIGEITNGKVMMDKSRDDFKRIMFPFRNMQLKSVKRTDKRGNAGADTGRVMEEKSCLYFECLATVGPLQFKVSTISLPVVVISHGSQEALAVSTISWDNAFGELGRVPFKVPATAPWSDVAQILNAKFMEVTGRGLTNDNLVCLARKVFGNTQPQPENISWSELCKENLPGRNFTFWAWFHAALKLIEKKETHLKEVWKEGLITGFIERETAESVIAQCQIGTFLLRFSDSITGAITIALLAKPGTVVSLKPFQMLDLQSKNIAMSIKELETLKYLYQPHGQICKDQAFGKFYDKNNGPQPNGKAYVPLLSTIPDGQSSNASSSPSTSTTPVQSFTGYRFSQGSLPGLSPISLDSSQSPIMIYPLSPATANGLIQDSVWNVSSPASNIENIDTPLPIMNTDEQVFRFRNEFADLIKVIEGEGDIQMEEQI